MFLHSGASLHGHEYSNRSPSAASSSLPSNATAQRRNPLLRSALAASTSSSRHRNRASTGSTIPFSEAVLALSTSPSSPSTPTTSSPAVRSRPRPVSDYIPRSNTSATTPSPELVVRFKEPEHESFHEPATPASPFEAMSEYEGSVVEISDGRTPKQQRAARKSTTFLLAQPPPKLRHKQRLMHTRPKLFLQMQQLSPDSRPRPIIDVYPSSAFAKTIVAPLLKRFPLISRIKSELSVQDIMVVRAENYNAHAQESDSDGDDDNNNNIKGRDLVAILSPLRTEDKAEIVLADGTVWVATPRPNGSYDFVSANMGSKAITARWVRKQVVNNTKSSPAPPTSPTLPSPRTSSTSSVDYKYTFSIIDPNTRRHPIMATLTNSSLDILDSYVTISPVSEDAQAQKTTRPVEDWHRAFISVSAIWVALRHGWAPNCRPTDLISPTVLNSASSKRDSTNSNSATSNDASPKSSAETKSRRHFLHLHARPQEPPTPGHLPRRATSTGAAFIDKRRAMTRSNSDFTGSSGRNSPSTESSYKASARRALSGDWECRWRAHQQEKSLAAMINNSIGQSQSQSQSQGQTTTTESGGSTLAPATAPFSPSAFCARHSASPELISDARFPGAADPLMDAVVDEPADMDAEKGGRGRHHLKWRHISGWFRKLGPSR